MRLEKFHTGLVMMVVDLAMTFITTDLDGTKKQKTMIKRKYTVVVARYLKICDVHGRVDETEKRIMVWCS